MTDLAATPSRALPSEGPAFASSHSGSAPAIRIAPETGTPQSDAAIEALCARVFGPGRFAKASQRVREQAPHRRDLSFTAHRGDALVGSVRLTPIRVGGDGEALLLGPLAVELRERGRGAGLALLLASARAARATGERAILLVGDPPYYARAGYVRAPCGVRMPGPVDPARLLGLDLVPGALEGLRGPVRGRW